MIKYTPGPWALDESRHMGCINRLEPYKHIGMVSVYREKPSDAEENRANAYLMAAAPELLEALRTVVGLIQHKAVTPLEIESIDIAKRAIAKARGES